MKTRMHSTAVKRHYLGQLVTASLLFVVLANPVSRALASDPGHTIPAQSTVTASAVVVPAHRAGLAFLISGIAKDVPVREGDLVEPGQTLLVLDTPELQFAVAEAEAALRSAQSYADLQKYRRIETRRNGKIFYDVIPAIYRQRADVRVHQAQVMLELAQIHLTEGTLSAPFGGTVVSMAVITGEFVESNKTVVTLATLDRLQIETIDLSERDISKVKVGAPVDIFVEALNANFAGRVIGISPRANTVGGDVVFTVTVAFDEQPKGLLWGMSAEVTIDR